MGGILLLMEVMRVWIEKLKRISTNRIKKIFAFCIDIFDWASFNEQQVTFWLICLQKCYFISWFRRWVILKLIKHLFQFWMIIIHLFHRFINFLQLHFEFQKKPKNIILLFFFISYFLQKGWIGSHSSSNNVDVGHKLCYSLFRSFW